VVGLPACLLGNQGTYDAMFLPVIEFPQGSLKVQDFKSKSIRFVKVYTIFEGK
jgi:hypothetical protein